MDKNPFFYINNLYMIKKLIKIKNKLKKKWVFDQNYSNSVFLFFSQEKHPLL